MIRTVWRVLTAPFRALWYLADTQNQIKAGSALNAYLAPRLGARVTLLPPAIVFGLMALVILLLREPGNWFQWVVGLLMLLITVFVGGLYVIQLVKGEGGLEPRHEDVSGLMAVATGGSSKDRADAINRLWELLDTLSSSERDQFARLARSAIRDGDAPVRAQAIFAVGALKESSDVDDLKAALADADWLVRLAAANALSWQEPPTAIRSIARLLDDPEPMVREQVMEILRAVAREGDQAARADAIACLDAAGLAQR